MVRAKLTRADGSTLELEGTSEEVSAVLAWERPAAPLGHLQPLVLPIPYQPPASPIPGTWGPFSGGVSGGVVPCTATSPLDLPVAAASN
jgi:hypothetical protein